MEKRNGGLNARDRAVASMDDGDDADGLPALEKRAAGIDLGSAVHRVCAPKAEGRGRDVAKFGATTPDLEAMAAWLKERKVETVAVESTGVYWIAPHEVLERKGIEVVLVNTRELARVPGRKKTDRVDCKWIDQGRRPVHYLARISPAARLRQWSSLHACGLLNGSFRPSEAVCMLQTLTTKGEGQCRPYPG